MASPFDERSVRWCLAGATPDGVSVYCISIGESHYDVILWVYSPLKERWYLLTTVSCDVLTPGHHYCTLSACLRDPEQIMSSDVTGRPCSSTADHWSSKRQVVTYLETPENTACIFVFNVHQQFAGHLQDVYRSTDSHESLNYRFDNTTGPQLVDYKNCLFLGGSLLSDFGSVFRVFQVRLADTSCMSISSCLEMFLNKTFTLTEVYQFDLSLQVLTSVTVTRLIVWRDRLTLVEPEKLRVLHLKRTSESLENDPTFERAVANEILVNHGNFSHAMSFFMLDCCSTNHRRDLWLIARSDCDDTDMSNFYWLKVTCPPTTPPNNEERVLGSVSNPVEILDCCKKCVGSDSSFFWVDESRRLKSKMVSLASLQYWCFSTLFKAYPILKLKNVDPRLLGIPLMLWNRFVPDIVDDKLDINRRDQVMLVALD